MNSKTKYNLSLPGIILGILFAFAPLGWINEKPITIYPVFNNFITDYKLWIWRDISVFSLTHTILLAIAFYAILKRKNILQKFIGVLLLVNSLFVLFTVYLSGTNSKVYPDVEFSYSYGWLLLLFCIITLIISSGSHKNVISHENSYCKGS